MLEVKERLSLCLPCSCIQKQNCNSNWLTGNGELKNLGKRCVDERATADVGEKYQL
jgi:hypothetical protein